MESGYNILGYTSRINRLFKKNIISLVFLYMPWKSKGVGRKKPSNKVMKYVTRNRKTYRKRKDRINTVIRGFTDNSPFPLIRHVKMKYSGVHTMSVGTSGVLGVAQEYNLNSLYDPDATGAGHQPYGYDTLVTIYNRYKVVGCLVEITLNNPTIDAMSVVYQLVNPSNTSETINGSSPYTIQERAMGGTFTINASGSQERKKRFYVPMWKASGLTKMQFDADPDNFTGPVTGDPGNKIQFELACADLRGGSSGSVMYEIRLTYYAIFYQRKVLAQS